MSIIFRLLQLHQNFKQRYKNKVFPIIVNNIANDKSTRVYLLKEKIIDNLQRLHKCWKKKVQFTQSSYNMIKFSHLCEKLYK